LQHRADQARLEVAEELQRAQRGLAAATDFRRLVAAEEQPLVFAQRVLDLAVARQRGVVADAQPLRGLELGLVEVAHAALGHQPGGLVGQPLAAFAGAGLRVDVRVDVGVLAGVRHRRSPLGPAGDCTGAGMRMHRPAGVAVQKMSNASSLGIASMSGSAAMSFSMRSRSSALIHSTMPPPSGSSRPLALTLTLTMPSGGSGIRSGWPSSAVLM